MITCEKGRLGSCVAPTFHNVQITERTHFFGKAVAYECFMNMAVKQSITNILLPYLETVFKSSTSLQAMICDVIIAEGVVGPTQTPVAVI